MMRGRALVPILALLLLLPGAVRAEPETARVELIAPATVDGLWLRDVDGDGATDLLLLERRRLTIHAGREGALPAPAARWTVDLADDVTFVDVLPPGEDGPGLLLFGLEGARRYALADRSEKPLAGVEAELDWTDRDQANFAPLVRERGALLPVPGGVAWFGPGGASTSLALPLYREVVLGGDFLEETTIVTEALPQVEVMPGTPPALWALGGTSLLGTRDTGPVRYDVGFLPREGTRRIVDLDGDQVPDVIHEKGTNRERTFSFFRTPPAGGDLRPPAAVLRVSGYCLDPDLVDLDGDGYRDFVITALPIDNRNTMRALGGAVTAGTKAFLNRTAQGKLFSATPNASVASDVGVAIRFTPAGTIEIERSLTILVTGDYDGDGRKDLVIRSGDGVLTLRPGVRGSAVWAAEGREVAIPRMGDSPGVEGHPADLTGDGRDEIVLVYKKAHGGRDRVWVVSL